MKYENSKSETSICTPDHILLEEHSILLVSYWSTNFASLLYSFMAKMGLLSALSDFRIKIILNRQKLPSSGCFPHTL